MKHLNEALSKIGPINKDICQKAKVYLESLAMPHWALGDLLDLGLDLCAITGELKPRLDCKCIVVMAGDHGVVDEGVSPYPQAVTAAMITSMAEGGAGINALSRQSNSELRLIDMGVAADLSALEKQKKVISRSIRKGTDNLAKGPAMSREDAVKSLEAGILLANDWSDSYDVFGVGEMGIGNTTPASAIISVLAGKCPKDVTGRGTGLDDDGLKKKISVIEESLKINQIDKSDGVDVLAKIGGFEIGGMAGFILGCAAKQKPVLIDGLISTAAAMISHSLNSQSSDYMIAAHKSMEPGHVVALKHLDKKPLLDLNFRLGEGTGAAMAMNLVEASSAILNEMFTLEQAMALMSEPKA